MKRPYRLHHLEIRLRLDPQGAGKVLVAGRARFTLELEPNADAVRLRTRELTVQSVALVNGEALAFSYQQDTLIIVPPSAPGDPSHKVDVVYQTHIEASLMGGRAGSTGTERLMWADGETTPWFPHPEAGVHCPVDLYATVPMDWSVVANGDLLEEAETQDGKQIHWQTHQPLSSNRISLVAGPMQVTLVGQDPVPLWMWMHQQSDLQHAQRMLAPAEAILRFYSERLKCRYPHARGDLVFLPGMVGGQQQETLTLLMEALLDEDVVTLAGMLFDPQSVLAHELAHHWFGHLIRIEQVADLWLSEGFATYLACCWSEYHQGTDAFDFELEQAFLRWQEEEYLLGRQPLVSFEEDTPHLSRILYERGARVLHHLRDLMGEQAFWGGLANFVELWKGQTPTIHDFLAQMQPWTKASLGLFAEQWLTERAYPILEIGVDQGHLLVRQVQEGRLFTTPLWVVVDGIAQRATIEAQPEQWLPLPPVQRWLAFDAHCHLPGEIRLRADWPRTWLEAQAKEAPWARCRAEAVARLDDGTGWEDAHSEVRKRAALGVTISDERRRALLLHDPEPAVRAAAASKLPSTTPALRQAFAQDTSLLVRMAAAQALADGSGLHDASPSVRAGALDGMALRTPDQAGGLLLASLAPDEPLALRLGALQVAVKHPDPQVASRCIERALGDPFPYLRILAAEALIRRPLPATFLPLLHALASPRLAPRVSLRLLRAVKALALASE